MTSKLPWTTAAILIVAAVAVGTWAVFGVSPVEEKEQPPTPPAPGPATITVNLAPGTVFGAAGDNSCIENIYILSTNLADNEVDLYEDAALLGTITASGGSCSIAYNTDFVIVVAVTAHEDNMGQLITGYMKVETTMSADGSDWTQSVENSDDADEHIFDTQSDHIRVNVYWDNIDAYYNLTADDNLNITNVSLWCRG